MVAAHDWRSWIHPTLGLAHKVAVCEELFGRVADKNLNADWLKELLKEATAGGD